MVKKVNACGLTCPAPVLLVKDAVESEQPEELEVLVDNDASMENVNRFLTSKGYQVSCAPRGDDFSLHAIRDGQPSTEQPQGPAINIDAENQKIVVLIMTDRMGKGDEELGRKLMVSYIKTLKEMGPALWQLVFVNSGVKLTVSSSEVLTELQQYQSSGVTILACGTCLEHFNLMAEKEVGATTNMLDIVTATQLADKVITIG
jgi:selenium metabolism protein YedF